MSLPAPSPQAAPAPLLQPLELWLRPGPGPLLPQLREALLEQAVRLAGEGAEPLRWAITAVDPERGLRLEGLVVGPAGEPRP